MLLRLLDEGFHTLPHGHIAVQPNKVRRHAACDQILVEGSKALQLCSGLRIHEFKPLLLLYGIALLHQVDGNVRLHSGQDTRRTVQAHLPQILIGVIAVL